MSERKRSLRFGVSGALLGVALCAAPACSGGKEAPKPEVESPTPEAAKPPAPPVVEAPDMPPVDMAPDVAPESDMAGQLLEVEMPININPGPHRPDEKP